MLIWEMSDYTKKQKGFIMRNHSFQNYWLAGAFALSCLFFPLQAQAVSTISLNFDPANQTVNMNDTVMVDIVVAGLEDFMQIVSAFNLNVMYDPSVLTATNFSYGTGLDLGINGSSQLPPIFSTPGVASQLAEFSIESDSDLQTAQGNTVTLGTLSFLAIGPGTSTLTFSKAELVGTGNVFLDFSEGTGNVTVCQPTPDPIPEPSTLLLMATGSMGLLAWRRWKK